ncbi:MAG: type II toxin-antitoxin system RelE/ParE family toxin [Syntrophomonadaceae bacterium]|nr:type II toxin-antitoxin system RelE/ParE family toxin [Syntrophomonadaceae bacterium]
MAKLIILPPAARYLKKLKEKPLRDKYKAIIDQLLLDPYLGDPKTGDLSGVYCCDIFYNKTNYELAYTVIEESEETIVVILAGTRENFYEELKRYMQHPRK